MKKVKKYYTGVNGLTTSSTNAFSTGKMFFPQQKTLSNIVDNKVIPQKTKWDDIRETCDAYDFEMEKVMKKMKNKINK